MTTTPETTTGSDGEQTPQRARVALVTGGSGGIGTAIVTRLAAEGFTIAVHYAGNRDRAQQIADTATTTGARAMVVGADVADEQAVRVMFDTVEEELGGIDVVVHTAGIMLLSPLTELDFDDFDRMQRTNVRGTFVVGREAARRVRAGGAIVNFSSSVVRLSLPTYAAYAATKGAVDAMTMILARELRGRDITVNAVAPGPTATPLFLDEKPQEAVDHLASMSPLERLGQPEDIAELVVFLAGPARWINGQVLYANGGVA